MKHKDQMPAAAFASMNSTLIDDGLGRASMGTDYEKDKKKHMSMNSEAKESEDADVEVEGSAGLSRKM